MVDKTLYISGQIGFDPTTMEIVQGGVEAETKQALTNMGAILEAVGATHLNVVKVSRNRIFGYTGNDY
jgi:2-iminobutanoate/2-iminopropanoate deaminase